MSRLSHRLHYGWKCTNIKLLSVQALSSLPMIFQHSFKSFSNGCCLQYDPTERGNHSLSHHSCDIIALPFWKKRLGFFLSHSLTPSTWKMSLKSLVLIATSQRWKGQMREQKQRHVEDTFLEELPTLYDRLKWNRSVFFFLTSWHFPFGDFTDCFEKSVL